MIEEIKKHLIAQYDPMAILLHGSQARGDATPTSDYDIVVITSKPDLVKSHTSKGVPWTLMA